MSQIALFKLPVSPVKEAAINLIKSYVLRGDTIESLRAGHMGSSAPEGMWAQIGGYMSDKKYTPDNILVFRDMNGKEVNQRFKLKEIMREIRENES